jgi:hypothetical protein
LALFGNFCHSGLGYTVGTSVSVSPSSVLPPLPRLAFSSLMYLSIAQLNAVMMGSRTALLSVHRRMQLNPIPNEIQSLVLVETHFAVRAYEGCLVGYGVCHYSVVNRVFVVGKSQACLYG